MTTTEARAHESPDAPRLADVASSFVPRILERARAMELARRMDDDLIADMDDAGLFSLLVPKPWGGPGLGPREVNTVVELLAHGDVSVAWNASFYNLHNWFLCRFPIGVPEALFADRSSVLAAAVLQKPGSAERVEGGYRVTGRWGYATGILHGSHALVPALCDGVMSWCLVEREQLEVHDDWDVAAMAATGSVSIGAEAVFVPDAHVLPVDQLMHRTEHPGNFHEEDAYRLPFSALALCTASIYVGALDAGVELARDKLQGSSGPGGVPRIERQMTRVNWVDASQMARVLRLVRDAATEDVIAISQRGAPPTLEQEAQTQLDIMTLLQSAKDTLRSLLDASGTSGYRSTDLLRRITNDVAMLSTHALNGEYDVAMDRHARWLLGLGRECGDPRTDSDRENTCCARSTTSPTSCATRRRRDSSTRTSSGSRSWPRGRRSAASPGSGTGCSSTATRSLPWTTAPRCRSSRSPTTMPTRPCGTGTGSRTWPCR